MEKVQLKDLWSIPSCDASDMFCEYSDYHEICNPLKFVGDKNTTLYAIMDCGKPVGVLRITRHLWRECHGNIGISIRPTERHKGYGTSALLEMKIKPYWKPKACIDVRNLHSIALFEGLGWIRTGRGFDWSFDRKAVEYTKSDFSLGS